MSGRLPGTSLFLVWAPPHRGNRSAWLARELGIEELRFLAPTTGRGPRAALRKYPVQLVASLRLLVRLRPRILFVQSPPSFAAWAGAFYASATGAALVIDAHSDAFERRIWTRPRWLTRWVARTAVATIVTDPHWADIVRAWGGTPFHLPSPTTRLRLGASPRLAPGVNVAVVNTWAPDEPIGEVIAAAERLPRVTFHVTGRDDRVATLGRDVPNNVRFTGFLPQDDYHALLAAADAVVCLTLRDHTMQRGAAEAMAVGTPVVTSDWPMLRSFFGDGAVYVENTATGIQAGLRHLIDHADGYGAAIREVFSAREREWEERRAQLIEVVRARLADPAHR